MEDYMNKYLIYAGTKKTENNGGPKMVWDMVNTAKRMGYEPIALYEVEGLNTTTKNVFDGLRKIIMISYIFKKGDIVLLQFPLNRELMTILYKVLKIKSVHAVTMIHDVDYLRKIPLRGNGVDAMRKVELGLLAKTEYLICPNDSMITQLKKENLNVKFIPQKISDYMYQGKSARKTNDNTVIIAGNMSPIKAGYIYDMPIKKYKVALYGDNFEKKSERENVEYRGSFNPNELIGNLHGDYGLVWDGPSIDECGGNYGNYQRFNNPHKLSLYLAAGLPVIIWKKAALYEFVSKNGIGFGIDSLSDLNEEIIKHSPSEYLENVKRIQQLVSRGFYLEKALNEIEADIRNID